MFGYDYSISNKHDVHGCHLDCVREIATELYVFRESTSFTFRFFAHLTRLRKDSLSNLLLCNHPDEHTASVKREATNSSVHKS